MICLLTNNKCNGNLCIRLLWVDSDRRAGGGRNIAGDEDRQIDSYMKGRDRCALVL